MPQHNQPESSLYRRLGGYDVIAAVVDEMLARLREDPKFARFRVRSLDSVARSRQLLVDQISALAGGPCTYIGRDMKTAHAGLGISGDEWEACLQHTLAALRNHRVAKPEQQEFLDLFNRYKMDIVEATAAPPFEAGAR